jgi:hypothetical protein
MIIQFGNLEIKLLIVLIFPFFKKLRRLIRRNYKIKGALCKGFNDFAGLTLCGIFFLIIKIRSKSNKNIENTKKTQLKTISDNNSDIDKSSTAREKYFLEIQKKESENKKKK